CSRRASVSSCARLPVRNASRAAMKSSSDCALAVEPASSSNAASMAHQARRMAGRSAQKQPIRRIAALIPVAIPELLQEAPEGRLVLARDLHADQHTAIVRTVVAVMEETDVPAAAHRAQKLHERPGPLGEFEPVQDLV